MRATFDDEVNAYHFSSEELRPGEVVKTINLGSRNVVLDIDRNGRIVGVEVF